MLLLLLGRLLQLDLIKTVSNVRPPVRRSVRRSVHTYCVKVVDKAITMDNLRLLCLVVNVCRGTARLQWYKFLAD